MKKHLKAFCLIRSIKQPSQILLRPNHKYFNIIISCQTLSTVCSVFYVNIHLGCCACIKKKLILPPSLLLYVEHKVWGSQLVPSLFTVLQVLLLKFYVVPNKEVVLHNSPKMETGSGARNNNPWLLTTLRGIFHNGLVKMVYDLVWKVPITNQDGKQPNLKPYF